MGGGLFRIYFHVTLHCWALMSSCSTLYIKIKGKLIDTQTQLASQCGDNMLGKGVVILVSYCSI